MSTHQQMRHETLQFDMLGSKQVELLQTLDGLGPDHRVVVYLHHCACGETCHAHVVRRGGVHLKLGSHERDERIEQLAEAHEHVPISVRYAQRRLDDKLNARLNVVAEHGAARVRDQVERVYGPHLCDRRARVLREGEQHRQAGGHVLAGAHRAQIAVQTAEAQRVSGARKLVL